MLSYPETHKAFPFLSALSSSVVAITSARAQKLLFSAQAVRDPLPAGQIPVFLFFPFSFQQPPSPISMAFSAIPLYGAENEGKCNSAQFFSQFSTFDLITHKNAVFFFFAFFPQILLSQGLLSPYSRFSAVL